MKSVVAYFLISNSLHGAEKRVARIALNEDEYFCSRITSVLMINSSLFQLLEDDEEFKRIMERNGNRIFILPELSQKIKIINKLAIIYQVSKWCRNKKIKVIHGYLGAFSLVGLISSPQLIRISEITSPDIADSLYSRFERRRWLLNRIDAFIAVSSSVYNISKYNIIRLNRPLTSLYLMDRPYVSDISDSSSIDDKNNVIICASRFIERKNVLHFARVARKICEEFIDWKIMILGSGPQEEEIKSILKNQIKRDRVEVRYSTKIRSEFSASKIVVSLIEPDNYPSQSLFEAMAYGNAILVSDTGESSTFVQGGNGEVTNIDNVYSVLKEWLQNPKLVYKYMRNSELYYMKEFGERKYLTQLMGLYDSIEDYVRH